MYAAACRAHTHARTLQFRAKRHLWTIILLHTKQFRRNAYKAFTSLALSIHVNTYQYKRQLAFKTNTDVAWYTILNRRVTHNEPSAPQKPPLRAKRTR